MDAERIQEVIRENAELRRENAELRRENAELRQRVAELETEVGELRQECERLRKIVEEWKQGFRQRGKRWPRRRKADGERKPPGRKAGHAGEGRPDPGPAEQTTHRTAEACPGCTGRHIEATGQTREHRFEDIVPARKIVKSEVLYEYRCPHCGEVFWTQLSPELGPCPKTGPEVQGLVTRLRGDYRLPVHQVARMLRGVFGFDLSVGGVAQVLHRGAAQMKPGHRELAIAARTAPVLAADETGWRELGDNAWLWVFRTPGFVYVRIERSRGRKVVIEVLGETFAGVLVTDFYGVYTEYPAAAHQYCWPHLLRDAERVAVVEDSEAARRFEAELRQAYQWARDADGGRRPDIAQGVRRYLAELADESDYRAIAGAARLQRRIKRRLDGLLTGTTRPGVPLHNNDTEQEVRFSVLLRKVSFGTQSPRGSETLSILLSVAQTIRKRGGSLADYLLAAKRAWYTGAPPPSLLAMFPVPEQRAPT